MVDPGKPEGWGEGVFALPLLQLAFVRVRVRRADMEGEYRGADVVAEYVRSFARFGGDDQHLRMDWLVPLFLTAVAGAARLEGRLDGAMAVIDEADKRAEQAGELLYVVDIAIEKARIHVARKEPELARAQLDRAAKHAVDTGYRCRDEELRHLRHSA